VPPGPHRSGEISPANRPSLHPERYRGDAASGQGLTLEQRAKIIAATAQRPVAQGKPGKAGPIAAALRIPEEDREAIIAENPLLAEYLAWKRMHPDQGVPDFLKETWAAEPDNPRVSLADESDPAQRTSDTVSTRR
jgi:hypothetical protein